MNHTGSVYYDANGTGNDYTHTDANPTWIVSPGGKKVKNAYDENLRRISVTVAFGTTDPATTTFGYDLNGNLISVVAPKEQPGQPFAGQSTVSAYDERDRPYSVTDPLGNVTSCTYDAADRKASATRANGQVITLDSFDAMNRLLQSTAKQTPDPDAVTKYTYYTSGLLHTMQDPHLVAVRSGEVYNYQYDSIGGKTSLTYHWYPILVVYLLVEHPGFPLAAAYWFSKKIRRHFSPIGKTLFALSLGTALTLARNRRCR